MCGICGIIDYKGGYVTDERMRSMARKMSHRGPDDEGLYVDAGSRPQVGLGHRRLSIIDLSPLGCQPMTNEDGRIRIVLNGEIYNYRTLRDELLAKGHKFRSHTDTEVVIHLYEEHGEECVKYLRGMFAFAIWDDGKKTLLVARDRIGKKPLVYHHANGRFSFASEFASILESGLIDKVINHDSIHYYLTFGYIPSPMTIYKDVFKLPPAHILILKDDKITLKPYWQLDYSNKIDISEEDAAAQITELLTDAVKIRLYSDVPLGAFLSGGIDSSMVVALMSRLSNTRVKTFSIGFEEKRYDELKYARAVAERFGTDHHEFIVKPDALSILPLLVERYGEPYADSSCIPTYYVCRETRRHVTVALNGDGGDELFAGYERYQAMAASEIYQKCPGLIKAAAGIIVKALPDSTDSKNISRRIKRFFEGLDLSRDHRYLRWVSIFSDGAKGGLYSGDFRSEVSDKDPVELLKPYMAEAGGLSLLDRLLLTDTMTYLPNDLLVKMDITSMANSLEARSPFLDHKLMEFVARLPSRFKMSGFIKKYILKKAAADLLPYDNIHRKKMGFGVPVGKWFRGELKALLHDTLLSSNALRRGYFKESAVRSMINEHSANAKDHTFQLWALLMLELWHRRFID